MPFLLGKEGGGRGGVLEIAHLLPACPPPHRPSRKPGVRSDRVVRPAGTLPPFPPIPPVSPTHADNKRSQNDPKMILVSF